TLRYVCRKPGRPGQIRLVPERKIPRRQIVGRPPRRTRPISLTHRTNAPNLVIPSARTVGRQVSQRGTSVPRFDTPWFGLTCLTCRPPTASRQLPTVPF